MGDGGFDPCECIFNHEMAMRRLLSLLRQSQSYCTDNECLQDGLPSPGNAEGSGGGDFMMLAMVWMMMAAVMYLLRPSSMRGQGDAKPQGPPGAGDRDPEPPAVS